MIDKKDVLGSFRQELVKPLAAYRPPPLAPLPISPWIAMSLLQKAVRRGETARAIAAAATLLINDPDKLWRRLAGIVAEDARVAYSIESNSFQRFISLSHKMPAISPYRARARPLLCTQLTPTCEACRPKIQSRSIAS